LSAIKRGATEADSFTDGLSSVLTHSIDLGKSVVEQIPNMAMTLVGMGLGAGAGALTPVPGAAFVGGWAGGAVGNTLVEGGGQFQQALSDANISPYDEEAIISFLNDNAGDILTAAGVKGSTISAIDMATMKLAHGLLTKPVEQATQRALTKMGVNTADNTAIKAAKQTPEFAELMKADAKLIAQTTQTQKVLRNVSAALLDPAGEFAGEYLGEGFATGDFDVKNAGLEALASIGQSGIVFAGQKGVQYLTNPLRNAQKTKPPTQQEVLDIEQKRNSKLQEALTLEEAAKATRDAVAAQGGRRQTTTPPPVPDTEQAAAPVPDTEQAAAPVPGIDPTATPLPGEAPAADPTILTPEVEQASHTVESLTRSIDNMENMLESRPNHPTAAKVRENLMIAKAQRAQLLQAETATETTTTPAAEQTAAAIEPVTDSSVPVTDAGSALDAKAHTAQTSPTNNLPEPSQAQIEAGNYKKGHIQAQGLDISVENPAGSMRHGVDPDGKKWSRKLKTHYGYIRRSEGKDGEQVDVFVGAKAEEASLPVFVVNQVDPKTGKFDEHKVMLGFENEAAAKAAYLAEYPRGWKGLGDVQTFSSQDFKGWLKDGGTSAPAVAPPVATPPTKYSARTEGELLVDRKEIPAGVRVRVGEQSVDAKQELESTESLLGTLESILACVRS
jgi:hypothetical protein